MVKQKIKTIQINVLRLRLCTCSLLTSSAVNLTNLSQEGYLPHLTLHFKDCTSAFYFPLLFPPRLALHA